nr:DUF6357 family protein [Streptomyces lateritius]
MSDIVFTRTSGWIPNVIREDGELKLTLGSGADANHEPRTFTFSISEAHLAVIREDLARHLLLWSAVLPLCDAAGTRGRLAVYPRILSTNSLPAGPPISPPTRWRRRAITGARLVALIRSGARAGRRVKGDIVGWSRRGTTNRLASAGCSSTAALKASACRRSCLRRLRGHVRRVGYRGCQPVPGHCLGCGSLLLGELGELTPLPTADVCSTRYSLTL